MKINKKYHRFIVVGLLGIVALSVLNLYLDTLQMDIQNFFEGFFGDRLDDDDNGSKPNGVSEEPLFHGITIGARPSTYANFDGSVYNRFKRWGLDSVTLVVMWTGIENRETGVGDYDESLLQSIDRQVELAQSRGLYMFVNLRGPYDDTELDPDNLWRGWGEKYGWECINYNQDPMGAGKGCRDRYIDCLAMLAKRYPDCGIGLNFFPYHHIEETDQDVKTYYEVTAPAMYQAVRPLTDEYIIIYPIDQASHRYQNCGEYNRVEQYGWTPFPGVMYDDKLILGFNNHDGEQMKVTRGESWNYNKAIIQRHYAPMVAFQEKYDHTGVTFGCAESTPLIIYGDADERPIDQSRLDWVAYHLSYMNQHGFSWWYNSYNHNFNWATPIERDYSDSDLVLIIQEHA